MENVNLSTLASWCGGTLENVRCDIGITDICRNTAKITKGCLFTPLMGAHSDGHSYITEALCKGAAATLCSRGDVTPDCPVIRVADTLGAVQAIAANYRRERNVKLIGVTGSAGKTTTSRMIGNILKRGYSILKTEDDMNGQIGLTYAIFQLMNTHEAAVMEMGMSQYGELSRLTHIANPDIAVINSIGTAHIEFFGTRENILKAKLEILEGLKADGTLILNGDEPLLWQLKGTLPFKTVYYGIDNADADIKGEIVSDCGEYIKMSGMGRNIELSLPISGKHNVQNALGACAAAICAGAKDEDIKQGLSSYESAKGRQHIFEYKGFVIVDDCYNASPDALKASFEVVREMRTDARRVAVLGGMRELGAYTHTGHFECGKKGAECVDELLLFGAGSEDYRMGALAGGMNEKNIHIFDDRKIMAQFLKKVTNSGDIILFKGSHYMQIEEVLKYFMEDEG